MLVDYNTKKVFDVKLKELRTALTDQIAENADVGEVIEAVKQRRKEASLPDIDVVQTLWDAMMDAVQWSGKNQQQNSNLALRQVGDLRSPKICVDCSFCGFRLSCVWFATGERMGQTARGFLYFSQA